MSKDDIVKEVIEMKEEFSGQEFGELYKTQRKALEAGLLDRGDNFVIVAPTASGKTLNAEFVIYQFLKKDQKVLYLTPTASLCSDKEIEFAYLRDKGYNIATKGGWGKANLVITTFESFYRTALRNFSAIESFRLAIVDEFHILYDSTRGFNLEKAMTFLKKINCRIVCLSATFEDQNEIKGWLGAELVSVPREFRKVPLEKGTLDLTSESGYTRKALRFNTWLVDSKDLYPYIIFCSRKDWARNRALQLIRMLAGGPAVKDKEASKKEFLDVLPSREDLTDSETDLLECMVHKVAFHHSGLHRNLRDLVVEKFLKGEVDFLFATTGLAYGVNLPAKTVVLYDLTMFQEGKNTDIPVYMFTQMSGRAGRPQFGKIGYSYIVAKETTDIIRAKRLLEGKLKKARSHIANDDFFQKFILELIYSGRKKEEEIIGFLKDTFYYFQSMLESQRSLMEFDFNDILKSQLESLSSMGFVRYMGSPGFKLLGLGEVTVDFLLTTYANYELGCFIALNRFLAKKQKAHPDFELVLKLSREFKGARSSRLPNKRSEVIDRFFEKRGAGPVNVGHPEYSAYSVFFGWMENKPETQIETDFKVYASTMKSVSEELYKLLNAYEALAKKKNLDVSEEWEDFKGRVYYGVRKDELPFVKRKGIKRNLVRNLYNYCDGILKSPLYGYRGSMIEVLRSFCKDKGEAFFLTELIGPKVPNIGAARAGIILDVVREHKEC